LKRTGRVEKLIQQCKHLLQLLGDRVVALPHPFFQLRQAFGQILVNAE
jgi:hypothetical protein